MKSEWKLKQEKKAYTWWAFSLKACIEIERLAEFWVGGKSGGVNQIKIQFTFSSWSLKNSAISFDLDSLLAI